MEGAREMGEKQKITTPFGAVILVGEGGFEPPKSVTTDLQSAPFDRSGIPPYEIWSWWTDSNPRPADYKSAALPAELHQQAPAAGSILPEGSCFVNKFFEKNKIF